MKSSTREAKSANYLGNAGYGGSALFPCCAALFRERIAKPLFFKQLSDENLIDEAISSKFPPVLDYLEAQAPKDGFFFGDTSVSDIAVVSPLINASYAEYSADETRWPKLAALVKRAVAHPAFTQALAVEKEVIAALKNGELAAA